MLMTILGAATLTAAPLPEASGAETTLPDVSAEYLGRRWKDGVAAGTAAENPLAARVTASYGNAEHVNNSSRYNRYDFVLTNNAATPEEVSVCPQDVEVSIHNHRVQSEPAFALSFGEADWSRACVEKVLGPGKSVVLRTFFREWWDLEEITARRLREVKAETSAGVFTMRFTPAPRSGKRVIQVSSAY